jgi:predicted Zn finger-like uncharacterized protein
MKITCQSCQAKYTIADEKVLGKIVKIRCKKCSATIVVNGNDPSAAPAPEQLRAPRDAGGEPEEPWTVNVADGDQRTMEQPQVVAAYQSGLVTDDTYCWKDGMNDWLPLREIDPLYDACTATRMVAGSSAPPPRDATRAHDERAAAYGGPLLNAPLAPAGNGSPGAMAAPAAARRAGGRAPGVDLFGSVAQAGSEEDVLTSAPAGMPQAHEDAARPTGARNENSVLFSLNALTSKGNGDRAPLPGSEQSGLIDIRQLSAQMNRPDDKKKSRVDDIMNLAGGGAFSPSLGAPLLAPPPLELYSASASPGGMPGKNKGLIFLALGGGAFFIVAAIGTATVLMRGKGSESVDTEKTAGSASAAEATETPSSSAAMAAASASVASAAPSAEPSASLAAKDTPSKSPAAGENKPASTTAVAASKPKDTAARETLAGAAPAATHAAGAESDQPFNMGEAKAKLGATAASVDACKKPNGPTGTGRVVVMFAPSGAVQSATVSGPPYEGTPTGACVAARFRTVRVPAFGGSPFSVSKSFTIAP